jgi:hypothetical protein
MAALCRELNVEPFPGCPPIESARDIGPCVPNLPLCLPDAVRHNRATTFARSATHLPRSVILPARWVSFFASRMRSSSTKMEALYGPETEDHSSRAGWHDHHALLGFDSARRRMRGQDGALRLSSHAAHQPARGRRATPAIAGLTLGAQGVVMRFFIGALALAVICVIFGAPTALLLGWTPLTASGRQIVSASVKDHAPSVSNRVITP